VISFDIVIVNWNSGEQLQECVQSVLQADESNSLLKKIIIVDNASSDNSLEVLKEKSLQNILIFENSENLGFGKACNQGAKSSTSDFILFLNPDMLLFESTFTNLFRTISIDKRDNIGIYGIQLLDEEHKIQKSCARFPSLWNFIVRALGLNKINPTIFQSYTMENWNHKSTLEVDQVIGAFFMIKRDLFEKLNGFDERFFVYYEELDLSKRISLLAYKTLYVSESQAYHKGGGTSESVKAKRLFYNTRSKLIYTFKHLGSFQGFLLLFITYTIEPFSRMFFLLLRRKFREIPDMLHGFIMLYRDTFNIMLLIREKNES